MKGRLAASQGRLEVSKESSWAWQIQCGGTVLEAEERCRIGDGGAQWECAREAVEGVGGQGSEGD